MTMYDSRKQAKVHPLDKRKVDNSVKAKAKTVKSVKPVAKDTNRTRRARIKPTKGKII